LKICFDIVYYGGFIAIVCGCVISGVYGVINGVLFVIVAVLIVLIAVVV
jgi:hypothetical protein